MNWLLFTSGIVAAITTVGHFAMGSKRFLQPVLNAPIDDVPKKVMHSLFHYISTYLVLSTIFLILLGLGVDFKGDSTFLVRFIAYNYIVFAIIQIIIALTSKIEKPLLQLFQWVFFVVIAVLAWLGVVL